MSVRRNERRSSPRSRGGRLAAAARPPRTARPGLRQLLDTGGPLDSSHRLAGLAGVVDPAPRDPEQDERDQQGEIPNSSQASVAPYDMFWNVKKFL